ncbi:MAG: SpoIID/LytB domain-containing protein [Oscillospiraceae bacterium]|nr:SpoIID/LytB domain-containing protein [Oscillospiraceae bacterium]
MKARSVLVRIIAAFVCLLMFLGVIYVAFYGVFNAGADDASQIYPINTDNMVRVAKNYKFSTIDCLAQSQSVGSTGPLGLNLYINNGSSDISLCIRNGMTVVMRDISMSKDSQGNFIPATANLIYSPYNLISDVSYVSLSEFNQAVDSLPDSVKGHHTFPIISEGRYYIGLGMHLNEGERDLLASSLPDCGDIHFTSYAATDKMLALADKTSGDTILKLNTADAALYAYPVQPDSEKQTYYIINEYNYTYEGVFEYQTTSSGMSMINTVDFEAYMRGVLPYEISSDWPDEALKAFAIVMRSYTLAGKPFKHPNDNYDFCDSTHCQVYRGLHYATARTNNIINETKGLVCTYDNQVACTFYHAITGGPTISYKDAWDWSNESYPYLISVMVPYENYKKYTNGVWKTTVSLNDLSDYLLSKSKILSKLNSPVADVKITRYLDTGYAYELTLTGTNGNKAVFKQSDEVRNILTRYVKSSRMTISNPVTFTINDSGPVTAASADYNVISADAGGNTSITRLDQDACIITADGYEQLKVDKTQYIFNGTGWGHGVGISQYGIKDMADLGFTYDQIIKAYFPLVTIQNYSELN